MISNQRLCHIGNGGDREKSKGTTTTLTNAFVTDTRPLPLHSSLTNVTAINSPLDVLVAQSMSYSHDVTTSHDHLPDCIDCIDCNGDSNSNSNGEVVNENGMKESIDNFPPPPPLLLHPKVLKYRQVVANETGLDETVTLFLCDKLNRGMDCCLVDNFREALCHFKHAWEILLKTPSNLTKALVASRICITNSMFNQKMTRFEGELSKLAAQIYGSMSERIQEARHVAAYNYAISHALAYMLLSCHEPLDSSTAREIVSYTNNFLKFAEKCPLDLWSQIPNGTKDIYIHRILLLQCIALKYLNRSDQTLQEKLEKLLRENNLTEKHISTEFENATEKLKALTEKMTCGDLSCSKIEAIGGSFPYQCSLPCCQPHRITCFCCLEHYINHAKGNAKARKAQMCGYSSCGASSKSTTLFYCSQCHAVAYCSIKHQRMDWRSHMIICVHLK